MRTTTRRGGEPAPGRRAAGLFPAEAAMPSARPGPARTSLPVLQRSLGNATVTRLVSLQRQPAGPAEAEQGTAPQDAATAAKLAGMDAATQEAVAAAATATELPPIVGTLSARGLATLRMLLRPHSERQILWIRSLLFP